MEALYHHFCPHPPGSHGDGIIKEDGHICRTVLIIETYGPINDLGLALLTELGRRMTDCTGDARETKHLLQRISVTIQRFNSILFRSSFAAVS